MPADFQALKQDLTRRMDGAMETLKKEFAGLRTGRASGCGSCGFLWRGVFGVASTKTRPPWSLTAWLGTRSSSKPGSPSPVA